MTRESATLVVIAVTVLVFAAMAAGWWRRRRRDAGLIAPLGVSSTRELAGFEGFYVATTRHGAPLDRLAMRHLAFRSRVGVSVHDDGIALEIPGEPALFFSRSTLRGAGLATWTIDRVVEREGLAVFSWQADAGTVADSYVRLRTPGATPAADFVAAVEALTPTLAPATPAAEPALTATPKDTDA